MSNPYAISKPTVEAIEKTQTAYNKTLFGSEKFFESVTIQINDQTKYTTFDEAKEVFEAIDISISPYDHMMGTTLIEIAKVIRKLKDEIAVLGNTLKEQIEVLENKLKDTNDE